MRAAIAILAAGASLAGAQGSALAHSDLDGRAIYQRSGCVACHGEDAGGTKLAPPLAGHTVQQVRHAVRNPQGIMPRFGEDKIGTRELEALAAYIASLEMHASHALADYPGALESHLWMAHHALRRKDADHALHHLTHAREIAAEGTPRAGIDRALEQTRAGRLEQAAHAVIEHLSASVRPEVPIDKLHLKLALGAIDDGDADEARHHLRHYAEGVKGHDRRHAEQLIELIRKGNFAQAKKRLAHLM